MSVYSLDSLENEVQIPILKIHPEPDHGHEKDEKWSRENGRSRKIHENLQISKNFEDIKRIGLDLELERAEVNCDCGGGFRDEDRERWRGRMRGRVEMKERQDKKLRRMGQKIDNSAVRTESKRPTVSYLQLYYRKFNAEGLRSPKGSLRSDCGEDRSSNSSDERRRDLILDPELESFNHQNIDELQRDDSSEMNFYQRLLESAKREAVQRRLEEQANLAANIISRHQNSAPQLKIGPVVQKQQVYRRRCCGERRNFESDRVGFRTSSAMNEREDVVEAKKECLARRRSYGNAVSALNRQKIDSASRKLSNTSDASSVSKPSAAASRISGSGGVGGGVEITKDISKGESSIVPRKIAESQICNQRGNSTKMPSITRASSMPRSRSISAKSNPVVRSSERTSESRRIYGVNEDDGPSLHELRIRHFNEKRMIDQLIKRSMFA